MQVQGNNFNMGTVVTYDFDLGYGFNQHTSVDIGLPLITTRTFFPIVTADYRYTTILGRLTSMSATTPSTTARTSPRS